MEIFSRNSISKVVHSQPLCVVCDTPFEGVYQYPDGILTKIVGFKKGLIPGNGISSGSGFNVE